MYLEKGARMGYSNGILTLAIGAHYPFVYFPRNTERLIPLYTISVFVGCFLSQTGWLSIGFVRYGKGLELFSKYLRCLICYAIVLILFLFRFRRYQPFFRLLQS